MWLPYLNKTLLHIYCETTLLKQFLLITLHDFIKCLYGNNIKLYLESPMWLPYLNKTLLHIYCETTLLKQFLLIKLPDFIKCLCGDNIKLYLESKIQVLHQVTPCHYIPVDWAKQPRRFESQATPPRGSQNSYLGFISWSHSDNTPLNGKLW
jgi:hypothetical protein